MDLQPFLDAAPAVQIHILSALAGLGLGPVAILRRSRDRWHKLAGRAWVVAIVMTALSGMLIFGAPIAFFEIPMVGPVGPFHIFVPLTLYAVWQALRHIRAGRVKEHAQAMQSLYLYAMVIAGLFTLVPGRRLNHVLFPDAPVAGFLATVALVGTAGGLLWLRRRTRAAA